MPSDEIIKYLDAFDRLRPIWKLQRKPPIKEENKDDRYSIYFFFPDRTDVVGGEIWFKSEIEKGKKKKFFTVRMTVYVDAKLDTKGDLAMQNEGKKGNRPEMQSPPFKSSAILFQARFNENKTEDFQYIASYVELTEAFKTASQRKSGIDEPEVRRLKSKYLV